MKERMCLMCKAIERSPEAAYVAGLCTGVAMRQQSEGDGSTSLLRTFCPRHRELVLFGIQATCNELNGRSGESGDPPRAPRPEEPS